MRTLSSIFILSILVLGCTVKNPSSSINDNISASEKSPSSMINYQDTSTINGSRSIVHPENKIREISVGGSKADIQGYTSLAIQVAIDAIHNQGGGTVLLMPGNYDIIAPVKLYSNIELKGSGPSTVLRKCNGFRSRFVIDADYGELKATLADVSGFRPGMGIAVSDSKHNDGWDVTTAVITSIKDNTLYFDNYLLQDYSSGNDGIVSNTCSVIAAVEADNVKISNLTVDGNRRTNDVLNGCRGGGIYLHKVHNALVENVHVKDFNSDGISWQITEYVTVRNCEVSGCASLGIHPGTGSPYTLIENCVSHDNDDDGIFVCWRVSHGIIRNNVSYRNGRNGISTGHKDTDMLYENNHVYENGSDGICLRDEGDLNAPHRSIFKSNLVENNGMKNGGYGFTINTPAEGVVLENNLIRNSGNGKQHAAVFQRKKSLPVTMRDNKISGHAKGDIISE